MEKKRVYLMIFLPWLLIVFGFFTLNMFNGAIALPCMILGIVMMIERRWPEKWGTENC